MMKALFILVILMGLTVSSSSQTIAPPNINNGSIELISHVMLFPRPQKGKPAVITAENYAKFQFDLMTFKQGCGGAQCISYGMRLGNNWDIFTIHGGAVNRTRMVMLGKLDWTDKITVPYVEPWSELAPGESRAVTFDTSGGDGTAGSDGTVGSNGLSGSHAGGSSASVAVIDGDSISFPSVSNMGKASAGLSSQVSSQIVSKDGKRKADRYSPVLEARKGYMYVIRLKDDKTDQYVLLRVDDLKRGKNVVISYKRFDVPRSIF